MNHRSLLARATEGTDAPTPGYLYVDLAKAAAGNPNACQDMVAYLSNRMQSKNNPNIKFKCCKVIAKLCDQVPRNQFRRCVSQNHSAMSAIKESMNYRGTMDPVRGDEPNQKVRIAAKEALDAVYREAPSSEMSGGNSYGGAGGISSSYGPSPHNSGGGGGGMPGGRRMEGIGNPMFNDPRLDPRYNGEIPTGIKGVVKEAGEIITGMIKDPLARNIPDPVPVPRQGHSGNLPGYGSPTYGRPPPGQAELSRQTGGQWTMASNRGPGAVGSGSDYSRQQYNGSSGVIKSGSVGGSWGSAPSVQSHTRPSITINSVPGASSGGAGQAVSDGTYEKNLVLELCPPGGMKPVPPPDKLANFERTCATLNSDMICPVLLDCLEEGQPWIIRAKALCVMETCIAAGTRMSDGANPYRDFFHACQDEIMPLISHPRPAIKEPAKRVLQLLDIAFDAPTVAPPVRAPPTQQAPNLLDFGDETSAPVPAPAPASVPPPPPTQAPPPPPGTSAPAGGNMFGGMTVKSAPARPVQAPAPPPASLLDFDSPAPAPSNSDDIFRDVTVKPDENSSAASNGVTQSASMFDQMNIRDSPSADDKKNGHDNELQTVSTGGSAFGFINESASKGDDAAPSSARPVFDPLKLGTPDSSKNQKKTMQLSPEQMQAMAYQQMMMQQQYQQMQIAMAMQNQHPPRPGMPPMHPPLGPNSNMAHLPQPMNMNMVFQNPNPAISGFSFNAPKPAKKDDKKFDFVMDAMKSAGTKK